MIRTITLIGVCAIVFGLIAFAIYRAQREDTPKKETEKPKTEGKKKPWLKWIVSGLVAGVIIVWVMSQMMTSGAKTVIALTDDGKPMPTVYVGPGTKHRIYANRPWKAVSRDKKGKPKDWDMPAGWSTWNGDDPSDYLWAKAVKKGTVLEFQK